MIAGDHIGARQDAPMVRVGTTDLFYYSARILPNARLSYVFHREGEAIRDPRNPFGTETLLYDADRELSSSGEPLAVSELRMPEWKLPGHLREPDPASRDASNRWSFPAPRSGMSSSRSTCPGATPRRTSATRSSTITARPPAS